MLSDALDRGTDIPALWRSYNAILLTLRDVDGLTAVTRSMPSVTKRPNDRFVPEMLGHARAASSDGALSFAEAWGRLCVSEVIATGNRDDEWMATGELGHILERANRLDDAMELWQSAFERGSTDAITANRLSMNRERAKDYLGAAAIIQAALQRDLPANVAEQLRKRLQRCEARPGTSRRGAAVDVEAFSVRSGIGEFELRFQARIKPPVRSLRIVGSIAHCYGVSKDVGTLVNLDLTRTRDSAC